MSICIFENRSREKDFPARLIIIATIITNKIVFRIIMFKTIQIAVLNLRDRNNIIAVGINVLILMAGITIASRKSASTATLPSSMPTNPA